MQQLCHPIDPRSFAMKGFPERSIVTHVFEIKICKLAEPRAEENPGKEAAADECLHLGDVEVDHEIGSAQAADKMQIVNVTKKEQFKAVKSPKQKLCWCSRALFVGHFDRCCS